MAALTNAVAGKANLNPVAVLWSQGESDYTKSVAWYEERFRTVCQRFMNGSYGMKFPAVVTSLPKRPNVASPIRPAQAQENIAESMSGVFVASSLPVHLPDSVSGRPEEPIHYSQKTHDWLGEAFGRKVAEVSGRDACDETIVYVPDVGEVSSLPAQVTCYGTSGDTYELTATWMKTSGNDYAATLSGNPIGT